MGGFLGRNRPDVLASLLGEETNRNNTGIVQTSGAWTEMTVCLLRVDAYLMHGLRIASLDACWTVVTRCFLFV